MAWGFCHNTSGQATVAEVKQALCQHGPVGTNWGETSGYGTERGYGWESSSGEAGSLASSPISRRL